ncbi:MAG: phenylalanine--tRNA ligase subunit alpha [archaeon]
MTEIQKIINSLSPLERKIVPHLNLSLEEIRQNINLDNTSILRALKFLENKNLIKTQTKKEKIVCLRTNGIYYKKNHLPERRLLTIIENNNHLSFEEAKKLSKLSDNEFKVSLGVLKNKTLIEIKKGKLCLSAQKGILSRKTPEETFLETLPIEETKLNDEQKHVLKILLNRKEIIEIREKTTISFTLTDLGKQIAGKEIKTDSIEEVTPEIIKTWKKNKTFRHYDISSKTPKLHGGKRHFTKQSIQEGKRIWLDLGFKEMTGTMTQTSFWNFDALFTAQDHPVRDMHDTFFIKNTEGKIPSQTLVKKIKQSHEEGTQGSKGWQYKWSEQESKKVVLRTHTTCLSAQTLSKIKPSDLPAKFFSIGKCFRNETIDWSHGFEFNQTEGIVIAENANLRNLIAYLKEFAKKMGFEKIRIQPAYFPYTEPSLEGAVWVEEKQEWMEVLAAGIFRPEVVVPLLGGYVPVLAWGPGFDRLMMLSHKISDLRKIYENDIKDLREKEILVN